MGLKRCLFQFPDASRKAYQRSRNTTKKRRDKCHLLETRGGGAHGYNMLPTRPGVVPGGSRWEILVGIPISLSVSACEGGTWSQVQTSRSPNFTRAIMRS